MSDTPDDDAEAIRREIELRAYFKYCARGGGPDRHIEDWLAAEGEVLAERTPAAMAGESQVNEVRRNHQSGPELLPVPPSSEVSAPPGKISHRSHRASAQRS